MRGLEERLEASAAPGGTRFLISIFLDQFPALVTLDEGAKLPSLILGFLPRWRLSYRGRPESWFTRYSFWISLSRRRETPETGSLQLVIRQTLLNHQLHNLMDTTRSRLLGKAMRPGGTISQSLKPLPAKAGQPLVDGSLAHSQLSCHPDHRIAPLNSIHHQGSTMRAASCIVMKVHPQSPFGAEGFTSNQHSRRSSDGQPLLLNNLLRMRN